MKKAIKKSIVSTALLAILIFSFMACVSPFASADPIGIGKYVDVKVIGDGGEVKLTKVSSGEWWIVDAGGSLNEKLGAGIVKVEARNVENFVIDYWTIGDTPNEGTRYEGEAYPSIDFRMEKGTTYVVAYFKTMYTVNIGVSDVPEPEKGTITFENGEPPDFPLTVAATEFPLVFKLNADPDYHVSAICPSPGSSSETGEYNAAGGTLTLEVPNNYDIVVFFSQDGYAWVPAGNNLEVFFTNDASITFPTTVGGFLACGSELFRPVDWGVFIWDFNGITVTQGEEVTITLTFEGEIDFQELGYDIEVCHDAAAFYCDVTNDGIVNAADLSLVAQYNKATQTNPNGFPYDELYDTDRDGEITEADVHRVIENLGATDFWVTLEYGVDWFSTIGNGVTTVTIFVDSFSVFRAR